MPFGDIGFTGYWDAAANRVFNSKDDRLTEHKQGSVKLYKVYVAGTTSLNGISVWSVGDFAYYNGFEWSRLCGSPGSGGGTDPGNGGGGPGSGTPAVVTSSASYATRADAVAATIPDNVLFVVLGGYYTPGDGGQGAQYIRAGAAPTAHDWYFTTANGVIFVFCGAVANIRMAGAKGDYQPVPNTGTDDTAAVKRAFDYALKQGFGLAPGPYANFNMHAGLVDLTYGCFKVVGTVATPGANGQDGHIDIKGDGPSACMIYNTAPGTFTIDAGQCGGCYIRDFTARGSWGFLNIQQALAQTVRMYYVDRVYFEDYDYVAIAANSSDNPYWKIGNCKFNPALTKFASGNPALIADTNAYGCIALNGLCDQHEIHNNEFVYYNSAIKLEAGNNAKVYNNFFGGAMVQGGHDIWITPRQPQTDPNYGYGFSSFDNKYSFETVTANGGAPRWRVSRSLPADDALAYWRRRPDTTAETINEVAGLTSERDMIYINDYQIAAPFIYTTLNLGAVRILDPMVVGTPLAMFCQYAPGASRTNGERVRQNLVRIANWPTAEVRGLAATNYSEPVVISNRPELWLVDDPFGFTATSNAPVPAAAPDAPDYNLRNFIVANGGLGTSAATSAGRTDSFGGTTAAQITFSDRTGNVTSAVLIDHTVQAPGYVEFEIAAGDSASLGFVNFWGRNNEGNGVKVLFARTVQLRPGWRLVRIPFSPSVSNNSWQLVWQPGDYLAGTRTSFRIQRIRTYEAGSPVNFGHLRTQGSAWNEPHLVQGSWHFWVDSNGKYRMKNGIPTSALDGALVGA